MLYIIFLSLSLHGSHHVLPFWLLVASFVRSAAVPLLQCPNYQYTGAHFTDLGRMAGWINPQVLIQWPTGLELRTRGSQAITPTTKPTPGCQWWRITEKILRSGSSPKSSIAVLGRWTTCTKNIRTIAWKLWTKIVWQTNRQTNATEQHTWQKIFFAKLWSHQEESG